MRTTYRLLGIPVWSVTEVDKPDKLEAQDNGGDTTSMPLSSPAGFILPELFPEDRSARGEKGARPGRCV